MIKFPIACRSIARSLRLSDDIIIADWIEACIGFHETSMTCYDIVDLLMEDEIFNDQDKANNTINTIWEQLEKRVALNRNGLFYKIFGNRIIRSFDWKDRIAHSFCLLLSLGPHYDTWPQSTYNEQGELFEKLAEEAIKNIFPELKTFRTGWSATNCSKSFFLNLLHEMKKRLNLQDVRSEKWDGRNKKEYGVDILTYFDFLDNRCGSPFYLIQCASGKSWKKKIVEPNLNIWKDIISPHVFVGKGFAIPFYISDHDFYQSSVSVGGFFFDRTRLLKASDKKIDWVSDSLKKDIQEWIEKRVDRILEKD